jgi:hypothetical protein
MSGDLPQPDLVATNAFKATAFSVVCWVIAVVVYVLS